jgi:predicted transcriptional regulator of viral defense system
MLITYEEAVKQYGSDYRLQKALDRGILRKIERGVYSRDLIVDPFALIALRYPNSIFTGTTAYYLHGFSDVIPKKYEVATVRNARKIADPQIIQHFIPVDRFECGKMKMSIDNDSISIYNQERMILELLHNRNKLSFDIYKEVQIEFRNRIDSLDYRKIEQYSLHMPQGRKLLDLIQREIY